jgi:glutamyl-tRNA synthetase
MTEPSNVVTRFAPSPTGLLHIGGARTALFNWAFARHHGGTFILRLEDTDAARSSLDSARAIVQDLHWLGIHWDQGPDPAAQNPIETDLGPRGPYSQSRRLHLYNHHIQTLLSAGQAFERDGAVVFKMPRRDITVDDLILGPVTTPADKIEDLVIRKSDGFPTFHFANVIDDATMAVTHVIRAQEHLNNTHKHLALFEALSLTPPKYAHIPLIFNPDGSKMSKRDKAKAARAAAVAHVAKHGLDSTVDRIVAATSMYTTIASQPEIDEMEDDGLGRDRIKAFIAGENDNLLIAEKIAQALSVHLPEINVCDFRQAGYLPEVLNNYLALLGWNPGNDIEKFDNAYLIQHFSLDRVGKANARFDRDKLAAFNADAIKAMPPEHFAARLADLLRPLGPSAAALASDPPRLALFAEAYRERAQTLADPLKAGQFFFIADDAVAFDEASVEKNLRKNSGEGLAMLRAIRDIFAAMTTDWTPPRIEAAVKQLAESKSLGMGKVAQPLRVAVTGTAVSPPLGLTLAILGPSSTLSRIDRTLTLFGAGS